MNSAQANDATQGQDQFADAVDHATQGDIPADGRLVEPVCFTSDSTPVDLTMIADPVLRAAFEAWENTDSGHYEKVQAVVAAVTTAQQEQPAQEPVCKVGSGWNSGGGFDVYDFKSQPPYGTPLYAAPPTQPALSESDAQRIWQQHNRGSIVPMPPKLLAMFKAVEAHCRRGAK